MFHVSCFMLHASRITRHAYFMFMSCVMYHVPCFMSYLMFMHVCTRPCMHLLFEARIVGFKVLPPNWNTHVCGTQSRDLAPRMHGLGPGNLQHFTCRVQATQQNMLLERDLMAWARQKYASAKFKLRHSRQLSQNERAMQTNSACQCHS